MASWTIIPSFIKGLRWGFNKGNDLLNNVKYNQGIFANWNTSDTSSDSGAAGQGLSGQIRYAQGSGITSSPSANGDIDSHIVWCDFTLTSPTGGAGVAAATTKQIDNAAGTFGIDWRARIIAVKGVLVAADTMLPGGADDLHTTYSSQFEGAADDQITRLNIGNDGGGNSTATRVDALFWSDSGKTDGAALSLGIVPQAISKIAILGQDFVIGPIYGTLAIYASSSDGDLIAHMETENDTASAMTLRFIGQIMCSGKRTA